MGSNRQKALSIYLHSFQLVSFMQKFDARPGGGAAEGQELHLMGFA